MNLRAKVLVIDDNVETLAIVGEQLSRAGYHVDLADSTERACESMDSQDYDIVVSDIHMPGVNGFSFREILREANKNVVTIAMSAADVHSEALDAGFNAFVAKPFSSQELVSTISQAFGVPH